MGDIGSQDIERDTDDTIMAFMQVMSEKLGINEHKGGWAGTDPAVLGKRLDDEREELRRAIEEWRGVRYELANATDRVNRLQLEKRLMILGRNIARECADIANFAMMVADVCGGLEK